MNGFREAWEITPMECTANPKALTGLLAVANSSASALERVSSPLKSDGDPMRCCGVDRDRADPFPGLLHVSVAWSHGVVF